jgi:osmoprotectant transport system ATP-binding protein
MAALSVRDLYKSFDGRLALAPTSLDFRAGRTTVLVGPSGCGKTTLLKLLLGLVEADGGMVCFHGEPVARAQMDALRHRVGYVIQEGGLFPHLSARDNVVLMARYLGREASWIAARLMELAELVHLPSDLLARYPAQLSGGQRQRVALMRALMLDPEVLLLDEPLGALDPVTRHRLQRDLKSIFTSLARTVVLVTHDMHEGAWFADEIVLMREGRVVQQGSLDDLLERPADPFVTELIRAQRVDPRLAGV